MNKQNDKYEIKSYLMTKTKNDLIVLCKEYNCSPKGNKSDITDNLIDHYNITRADCDKILNTKILKSDEEKDPYQTYSPQYPIETQDENTKYNERLTITKKQQKINQVSDIIRGIDIKYGITDIKMKSYIETNPVIDSYLANMRGIQNYEYLKNDTFYGLLNDFCSASFLGSSNDLVGKYGIPDINDKINIIKMIVSCVSYYAEAKDIIDTILNN